MTIDEIKTLIANDEHRMLELKKTTGELKDGMHSACAMLNTDGGWLIFGIAPTSLKILGQEVTDTTRREIALALSHLEPQLDVHIDYVDVPDREDQQIIAMHFDGWVWGRSPYTYHGCPYYKVESTTKEMPREMFEERLKAAKPHIFAWENQIAEDFDIDDFNESHIMNAVRMGVRGGRMLPGALALPAEEILSRFSLMKNGKPLQAAVALFAKTTKFYSQLKLRMARFKGKEKLEFIDNKQVQGNFFELLDEGVAFCFKHLNLHGKVVGLQREENLDIPYEALREALINALCHRSYDSISASVSLAIYDDRIEIGNPGRFPVGITPDNIKLMHASKPYNPLIASVLYKTTWLESWGSGIQRMIEACKAQNVPEPYYKLLADGTIVMVFPIPKTTASDFGTDFGTNFGTNFGIERNTQLTERQRIILDKLFANGNETAKSISVQFGLTQRSIEKDLSFLRKNGYIEKTTKDNRSPWRVLKR
ncbi:MAG: putative DNA binding domain-containing protein [Bacteroidales bacterium]|nr:putative DNA binding domain-containing protein [Bacteroidales bacterium]